MVYFYFYFYFFLIIEFNLYERKRSNCFLRRMMLYHFVEQPSQ